MSEPADKLREAAQLVVEASEKTPDLGEVDGRTSLTGYFLNTCRDLEHELRVLSAFVEMERENEP